MKCNSECAAKSQVSFRAQTYKQDQGLPNTNPFTWAVSGKMYTALAIQAAGVLITVLACRFNGEQ